MKHRAVFAALFLIHTLNVLSVAHAQPPALTMRANPDQVEVGDTFQLRIEAGGEDLDTDSIQLPALDDFQVVGRSTQRAFSFQFGFGGGSQLKPQLVYVLDLRAVKEGAFRIGPARARAGQRTIQSEVVEVTVLKSSGQPRDQTQNQNDPFPDPFADFFSDPSMDLDRNRDNAPQDMQSAVFVKTFATPNKAYVGQQVLVSTRLYTRALVDGNSVSVKPPKFDGFWMQRLQTSDRVERQEINGRVYFVYELSRDAIFPLRPGKLTIGAASVDMVVGGLGLFSRPQRIKRQAQDVEISVEPLPQAKTQPVIVGSPRLEFSVDRNAMRVGDAATVRALVSSEGDLRNLKLELQTPQGLRQLQPNTQERSNTTQTKFTSQQQIEWLVIADQPGSYEIKLSPIEAFDPASATFQTIQAPVLRLDVAGATAADGTPVSPTLAAPQNAKPNQLALIPLRMRTEWRTAATSLTHQPWFFASVILPWCLLLLFAGAIYLVKRRRAHAGTQSLAFDQLEEAQKALRTANQNLALQKTQDALDSALSERLATSTRGLSDSALQRLLREKEISEALVTEINVLRSDISTQRFAASTQNQAQIRTLIERARRLIPQVSAIAKGRKS